MSRIVKKTHDSARMRASEFYRDPVRVTALTYLKEALIREQYELCADIVAIAREFGATEGEIRNTLEDPRRRPGG